MHHLRHHSMVGGQIEINSDNIAKMKQKSERLSFTKVHCTYGELGFCKSWHRFRWNANAGQGYNNAHRYDIFLDLILH
jgi:hypothetical protein